MMQKAVSDCSYAISVFKDSLEKYKQPRDKKKKFVPALLLLASGIYFWWSKADTAPSEIFTTWRTGTDDRLLTLYQGTSKDTVDGYFYNSKSGD